MSENRFGFAYNSLGEIEVKSLVGEIQHVLIQDTDGNAGRVLPATLVSAATRGDDGDSAYTIAVAEGFSGTQTEWIASLTGSQGSQGISGTITVGTVTTGSADTSAIISNSGTLTNAVFDFQIPRGNTGAAGSQGIQGIQGIQGDTGPKGSKGDAGDTGSQGIQGLQGITGPQGNNGTNGTSGTNGTDGDGWTGGTYSISTGIVTFASDDGLGFTTSDLRGATGPIGNNGPQGDTGVAGDDGADGVAGDTGSQGIQGIQGVAGDAGADGADGVAGAGAVDSVNTQTGVVVLDADDIADAATTNKFVTASDVTNLGNLSGTNTGDQDLSGLQPLATVLSNTTASFTTTLSGNITTNNAKVTNATHTGDVTGSGALTIAAGAVDIPMLSATGTASSSTYLRGDNTWASVSGSGDVSKVGTPVDNQVGVWTGDGTIEGTSGFTWGGSNLAINGTVNLTGNSETAIFGDDSYVTKYVTIRDGVNYAVRWGLQANTNLSLSGACLMSSSKPIAFKANTSIAFGSLTTFDLMINSSGNILVSGTVDGRNVATDGTKLDGIEAGANVTDSTNVTAAGALMDSEVDAGIKTLVLPASTTISTFGASLIDDASSSTARTTLGVDVSGTDNSDNNAVNTLYSGLVTNATHTGDVTGSTSLTISAGAVDIAMHSATGTASSTTFLRGDNTWAVPAGGGGGSAPAIFYALGSGSLAIGTVIGTIPLATAVKSDTGYSVASNQVTIGSELDGKWAYITWAVAGSGATNRVEIRSQLQVDTVVVKASSNYTARNSAQTQGGVQGSHYMQLSTGQVIRMQALRDGSTANLLANETHLSIETKD